MRRRVFDILTSAIGFILVIVLAVAGGLLLWGHNYTHNEVSNQLSAQKIFFPPANSPAIAAPEFAGMKQYAGQQLTTGPQAKVYANDFIANHLKAIGGGQTYSQLSAQLQQDPTNTKLAQTVQTMFQGETLRGLLLTSSAFWELGTIAGWAALAAFIGAGILLILSVIGLFHSRGVSQAEELLAPAQEPTPSAT
jgi:hypothetical protein